MNDLDLIQNHKLKVPVKFKSYASGTNELSETKLFLRSNLRANNSLVTI
jgi:hypothetical protein